jgi:hypothetical protein
MIYLLDLNYTLVENSTEKYSPFIKQVEHERYRQWLVELLRDKQVILITARPVKYDRATLTSIQRKTGWQPGEAYFNHLNLPPPAIKKSIMMDIVFPKHGSDGKLYYGLESNPRTRAMYEQLGIASQPVEGVPWSQLPV